MEWPRRRITIIGAGTSGLGAAWRLSRRHDVALFETERRLGGHSRTISVQDANGWDQELDTGFIAFNEHGYPHLSGLFRHLGIASRKSDMSFTVSVDNGALEYGCRNVGAALAQGSNILKPSFWRMFREIERFGRTAQAMAKDASGMTVATLLSLLGMGDWFRRYYLLPVSGAICSLLPAQMLALPATSLIRFFANRGFLSYSRCNRWRAVVGGSTTYVERMQAGIGAEIRSGARVEAVTKEPDCVLVRRAGQEFECYDHAILACHAEAALRILKDAEPDEGRILRAIRFRRDRAVVHRDPGQMPRHRACWSCRVFLARSGRFEDVPKGTYRLNSLRGIPPDLQVFETLNPDESLKDEHVLGEQMFSHQLFDLEFLAAQKRLPSI